MGLNRTFMELKLFKCSLNAYTRDCLNRTFMELKFRSSFTGHYERRFKSHLYGIEIKKNSTFGKPRYV